MRAAGAPMSTKPYLAYLRGKYGELYRLPGIDKLDPLTTDGAIDRLQPPMARN
jgi:hypothetical protein